MEQEVLLGLLAFSGVLIVGLLAFISRRNGRNNNAHQIVDIFIQNTERVAASLERFAATDERLLEGQRRLLEELKEVANGLDELVKLHIKMEGRRETLSAMIDERGETT